MATYKLAAAAGSGSALVDYHNCLTSLRISGHPYSEARHAGLLTLIHFRRLTPAAQEAFDGELLRGMGFQRSCRGFLCAESAYGFTPGESQALMNLRGEAYGRAAHAFVSGGIAGYPWALTASEFQFCYRVLKYGGKEPEIAEQNAVLKSATDVAADRAWDEVKDLVCDRLLTFGSVALRWSSRAPKVTAVTVAAGFVADVAKNLLVERLHATRVGDLMAAYECDRVRRGVNCDE